MKKILAILAFALTFSAAHATDFIRVYFDFDSTYLGYGDRDYHIVNSDGNNCIFAVKAQPTDTILTKGCVTFGSRLSLSSSRQISFDATGLATTADLAAIPSGPKGDKGDTGNTGATGAAGTTDFNALTNRPIVNRARITTASDGTYSWTLPTACATGTTPIVSITPESSTAGDAVSHRVTSISNTTVGVFAGRSAGLTVLTLTVLGVPAGAAIPLHLIAICP